MADGWGIQRWRQSLVPAERLLEVEDSHRHHTPDQVDTEDEVRLARRSAGSVGSPASDGDLPGPSGIWRILVGFLFALHAAEYEKGAFEMCTRSIR